MTDHTRDDISKVRWRVVALLFLISMVTFLARLNIAVSGKPMSEELGLSDVEFGTIFGAFALGYALFQIPSGWLGDRVGHRRLLASVLVFWSILTALTPWSSTGALSSLLGVVPAICAVRFLIGVGEAAALPSSTALIGRWFPAGERGRATGIMFAGVGLGCTITPPLIAWLMVSWGWEISFYISGLIGIVVAVLFVFNVTEHPRLHPRVNQEELRHIDSEPHEVRPAPKEPPTSRTPWKAILLDRNMWLLTISYGSVGYVTYVFFSWFYRYLTDARGLDEIRSSYFAMFPFLAVAVCSPLGGLIADRLIPRFGRIGARRLVAVAGLLPGLPLLIAGAWVSSDLLSLVCLTLAIGFTSLSVSCYWATVIEILPSHAGTSAAIMNTGTNLVGAAAPVLTPLITARYGWVAAWAAAGASCLLAGLLWLLIKETDAVTGEDSKGSPA